MTRRPASPSLTRSLNALRHGLTNSTALLPGELAAVRSHFAEAAAAALTTPASSTLTRLLADRAGEILWRLTRAQRWETALLDQSPDRVPEDLDKLARYEGHLTRQLRATIEILATLQPPRIPGALAEDLRAITHDLDLTRTPVP